jgi:hypothetical protein
VTAEPIAELIADIRRGRVDHPAATDGAGREISELLFKRAQLPQPVVDCTAIFQAQLVREEVNLYDDYPSLTPPWENAFLCYVNTFGNVVGLQVHRTSWDGTAPGKTDWYSENESDWSRVRWVAETAVWIGGRSGDGKYLPTSGPCHVFRHAIRDDGAPEDINWLALLGPRGQRFPSSSDPNQKAWDAGLITLGASLNFLNASNVEIAEPQRPRPERRRLARTGVTVQAIVVRPPGKRRAASSVPRPIEAGEQVFSPVRGHFARYGPEHDRGLLFGKYAGKFWIAAHARGAGETEPRDYLLKPGAAA